MKKLLFISKSAEDSSTRNRLSLYFPHFEEAGLQPLYLPHGGLCQRLKILLAARKAEAVIINRKTYSTLFLRLLRFFSKKLIFNFDDAIFLKSNGEPSRQRMRRFRCTIKACHEVWAGNDYLCKQATLHNTNSKVIPTAVDPEKYDNPITKPENYLDLIWVGSKSTAKYLQNCLPLLEHLAKEFPSLRLKNLSDVQFEGRDLTIINVPWHWEKEAKAICSAHIGIAPLQDDPWTRGKCALKIIQYMAAGLPTITSPVGANKDIITHRETGFYAHDEETWRQALFALQDKALREKLGSTARQRCLKRYSLNAVFKEMLHGIT